MAQPSCVMPGGGMEQRQWSGPTHLRGTHRPPSAFRCFPILRLFFLVSVIPQLPSSLLMLLGYLSISLRSCCSDWLARKQCLSPPLHACPEMSLALTDLVLRDGRHLLLTVPLPDGVAKPAQVALHVAADWGNSWLLCWPGRSSDFSVRTVPPLAAA